MEKRKIAPEKRKNDEKPKNVPEKRKNAPVQRNQPKPINGWFLFIMLMSVCMFYWRSPFFEGYDRMEVVCFGTFWMTVFAWLFVRAIKHMMRP